MRKIMWAASAAVLAAAAGPAAAQVVNLGSSLGFTYENGISDPAPVAGQHINFIGEVPTLTLGAGTYRIVNATGMAGANPAYTAWSYNVGASNWTWAFVLATSGGTVIDYQAPGFGTSQAEVAAQPSVRNFSSTFTLAAPTTVAFTLRDYFVSDNAGGVSLFIAPAVAAGVPEPGSWMLMIAGFGLAATAMRRRQHGRVAFA